jgi:8-oxo-dGTP pyrophosphatase MutT (NUDIX family)
VPTIAKIESSLVRQKPAPPPDAVRCAAVAVVLHERNDDLYVLLLKRAEHQRDPWSGHVSLPGGRFEDHDEHLHATAIRETMEETGIDLTSATWHGHSNALHPLSSGPRGMAVTPFVFSIEQVPAISLSPEATHYFWLPLRSALGGALSSEIEVPREASNQRFPCWRYQGYVVWGLTLRILMQLQQ